MLSVVNAYFKGTEKEDVLKISSLALLEMQDYLKALNFLTRLVKFYPHPLSFNYLAICYAKLNQKEEKAYNSFQKALNLDNQNALIYINFANF